jgi:non-ribosomal peptide synthetase component E (peptide arylation enzyme)
MIPKEFVFRESLPKTMIGKVDYKKLENEKSA